MDRTKSSTLKLKTRTLLTFENKAIKKADGFADTDPTTTTATTSSVIFTSPLFMSQQKKG